MGVTKMTKEHIGISLALKLPLIFVVTKLDMCPENVLERTMGEINRILKLPGVRKLPFLVRSEDDAVTCAKNIATGSIVPIIQVRWGCAGGAAGAQAEAVGVTIWTADASRCPT